MGRHRGRFGPLGRCHYVSLPRCDNYPATSRLSSAFSYRFSLTVTKHSFSIRELAFHSPKFAPAALRRAVASLTGLKN